MIRPWAALAVPLLAGCMAAPTPSAPSGPVLPFQLDAGGIAVLGEAGGRIDFGRDAPGVIDTMTRLQGAAPASLACPDVRTTGAEWRDGLILVFRDGAFAGWATPDGTRSADGRTTQGAICIGPV